MESCGIAAPPASVRYYFDADILGLAKIVASIRADATYPGDSGGEVRNRFRPPCPITDPATKDVDWIPLVASRGVHHYARPADRGASRRTRGVVATRFNGNGSKVEHHGAKLFRIASKKPLNVWGQLEVLMARWRDIQRLGAKEGPFIHLLYRTSVRQVL